ncbi:trigger factor [Flavisolibacter ginsengisoli]|jgi:trigger factor|uniref:Trigger factor n=1 Tax=Flavisolibacter ginsengisoli DSM 18119 TaxID=1121884 RepID=A0A1M4W3N9_9BACT|nr:trigger factor [Flavisolibacter ginsengisoli]SHE75891.1 trigger factor [Flavisolibacter ginsengisoli DSM 18119]
MATVTQQEVAPLHKQFSITINKEDYLPQFEKSLKEYSKKANIPGFRKGMVPAGLIKKMYGSSLFTDEVLKTVDKEVFKFIEDEKLDIFAQPLPVDMNLGQLDVNNPNNYTFTFEIGMKPGFQLPDLAKEQVKRYKVNVTDEMLNEEIERLRTRYGNMTEPESVSGDENVLNVTFIETDASGNEIEGGLRKDNSLLVKYFNEAYRPGLIGKKKDDTIQLTLDEAFDAKEKEWILNDLGIDSASGKHFKLLITKVGHVEPRELNEEFFTQLFPNDEVKTEEEFRERIKQELQKQWDAESRNQLHHSLYHVLLEHTNIDFPADFLKRWIKSQAEKGEEKTDEEVEKEFPAFLNQLKWSLITDKMVQENGIQVSQDDLRQFAKDQLLGYMGTSTLDEEQQWVRDYIDRMMKDRKYVEDSYNRLQTQKIFDFAETKINAVETPVSKEEFIHLNEEHQHHHH